MQLSRTPDFATTPYEVGGHGEAVVRGLGNGRWFWRVLDDRGHVSRAWSVRVVAQTDALLNQGIVVGSDFDGDGVDDLAGEKAVFLGGSEPGKVRFELTWPEVGDAGNCDRSAPLAVPVGDLDGDGCSDLLLCGLRDLDHMCLLFDHCAPQDASATWEGSWLRVPDQMIGVVRLGDVNGDGRSDLAMRFRVNKVGHRWSVFLGGSDWREGGIGDLASAYASVVGGGDLDGDGMHDFVGVTRGAQHVHVHFGRRAPLLPTQDTRVALPGAADEQLRSYVAVGLGDVDGDGYADIVAVGKDDGGRDKVWVANGGRERPMLAVTSQYTWVSGRVLTHAYFAVDHSGQSSTMEGTILVAPGNHERADLVALRQTRDRRLVRVSIPPKPHAGEPISVLAVGDVTGDGVDDLMHPETLIMHHLNVYAGQRAPTRLLEQPHWRLESQWDCNRLPERNVTFFESR